MAERRRHILLLKLAGWVGENLCEKDGMTWTKRITVVLADANEEFRTALKQALEATGEFDVVGCAPTDWAAAQDIAERKPQLLVMDLLLPGLDGFACSSRRRRTRCR